MFCTCWLRNVLRATTACTFSTSQLPKVVRSWSVFAHVDFEMCFAPQRRALFRHLNFQKWSEPGVLCTFWLRNVLRATTACTFLTSQLPKVVRTWCMLYFFTSKSTHRPWSPRQNLSVLRPHQGTLGHGKGPSWLCPHTWAGNLLLLPDWGRHFCTPHFGLLARLLRCSHKACGQPVPLWYYLGPNAFTADFRYLFDYHGLGDRASYPSLQSCQCRQWDPYSNALGGVAGPVACSPDVNHWEHLRDEWGHTGVIDPLDFITVPLPKKDPASAGCVCVHRYNKRF